MLSLHRTVLLMACILAGGRLAISQILPKFSGVHSRNNGGSGVQLSNPEESTIGANFQPNINMDSAVTKSDDSLLPRYLAGALAGLLSPMRSMHPAEGTTTFRLSILPSGKNLKEDIAAKETKSDEEWENSSSQLMTRLESIVWRGDKMVARGQIILAEKLYKEAIYDVTQWVNIEDRKSHESNKVMSGLLNRLAVALYGQGLWKDALNALSLSLVCFDRSIAGRETSADMLKRARLVSNMGSVAMQDTNFPVAVMYFHDVVMKMLGNRDERDVSSVVLLGKIYTRLGGAYLALSDIPQAIFHFGEGAAVLRTIYHPETMIHAAGIDSYAVFLRNSFADALLSTNSSRVDQPVAIPSCSCPAVESCVCDCNRAPEPSIGRVLSDAAADGVRHVVVGIIAMLVTGSGLLALFPPKSFGGIVMLPEDSTVDVSEMSSPGLQSPSKPRKVRRKLSSSSVGADVMRTPDPSAKKSVSKMDVLSDSEESQFSAIEVKAMGFLRDMEYKEAEDFLTEAIAQNFGPTTKGGEERTSSAPTAKEITECRLRYMLSKALSALEKFQESERELFAAIDKYLKLGVIDDIAVAAVLDYSLSVIRDQLYDEKGEEKFTPDRFVRAHNVFCSLLFGPYNSVGKLLQCQRFQISGPVDAISVQTYGLMSPACSQLGMSMSVSNSPFFRSPIRPVAKNIASEQFMKYSNANEMLKSLEKVFYLSQRRKDEIGSLELMCSEFEDLADEMDKCLNFDDEFSLCFEKEEEQIAADFSAAHTPSKQERIQEDLLVDKTHDQEGIVDDTDCPNTNTIRLGSTTGDTVDFEGDTFDDLLMEQEESVLDAKQGGVDLTSPGVQRVFDHSVDSSFASPMMNMRNVGDIETPYFHMRHGVGTAAHDSEAKENNNSCSIAGTDGYSTDHNSMTNSAWAAPNTGGHKRKKRKQFTSPVNNDMSKPIR